MNIMLPLGGLLIAVFVGWFYLHRLSVMKWAILSRGIQVFGISYCVMCRRYF